MRPSFQFWKKKMETSLGSLGLESNTPQKNCGYVQGTGEEDLRLCLKWVETNEV